MTAVTHESVSLICTSWEFAQYRPTVENKCEHLIAQPHLRQCYEYVNWIPIWFLIGQTSQFRNSQNHLFWVGERLGDYILWKIMQPLPSLHNLWKFQLSIIYGFRKSKITYFEAGERLRDYILWKIRQPLPILHNLWKFQLSIIYSLEQAKITYFGLVRGWVTLFCEKSRNLYRFCTICGNFNFPSFTI